MLEYKGMQVGSMQMMGGEIDTIYQVDCQTGH